MSPSSGSSTPICLTGWGAVSPAGWNATTLADAVLAGIPLPHAAERRVPEAQERKFRRVPPIPVTPEWMKLPRLRRTTSAARHAVHAAMQALGEGNLEAIRSSGRRIGTIFCTMSGCVQFSRRFYAEVLANPLLASPILFPETVYNAPASHVSSLLGSPEMNYTLVGDSAQFLAGLDLAAQWLDDGLVDACLVIAAEELDWISDEALLLFAPHGVAAEGAAAVLLEKDTSMSETPPGVTLHAVTEAFSYGQGRDRAQAAAAVRGTLEPLAEPGTVLCEAPTPIPSPAPAPEVIPPNRTSGRTGAVLGTGSSQWWERASPSPPAGRRCSHVSCSSGALPARPSSVLWASPSRPWALC
ncbi:beta-ketoacyl synthase N-terminal-like domain-containing protein [Verrucomicrobium spinosum]|uniref:beta-ketoacyl synthase N-terminal-like domain-containing protein n=1 Tax=Verrucomicrobium spinosum TaxID=2736 RepID=UPI0009461A47|nr:beta-ketoacyl synthase N-terminal-like domain-containing protein [Verrucomicrobium spinosum]